MAAITEGAAGLVAAVRLLVRDAIATCVSRLIVYAGELVITGGLAAPLVVEQVTTLVASWAARIARLLRGLLASLRRLIPEMRRLGDLIEKLKQALGRLGDSPRGPPGHAAAGARGVPGDPPTRPRQALSDYGRARTVGAAGDDGRSASRNERRRHSSATGSDDDADATCERFAKAFSPAGDWAEADELGHRSNADPRLTDAGARVTVRTAGIRMSLGSLHPMAEPSRFRRRKADTVRAVRRGRAPANQSGAELPTGQQSAYRRKHILPANQRVQLGDVHYPRPYVRRHAPGTGG